MAGGNFSRTGLLEEKMSEQTRQPLIADVASRRIPEGAVGIWWLGQATFILKGQGDGYVFIDPYLAPSPRRLVPPPIKPEEATAVSLVLTTHDHGDHIDPTALPIIAKAAPKAPILIPGVARERILSLGVAAERVIVPEIDKTVRYGDVKITAIPAAHEQLDYTEEKGYPYLGYIIEMNGVKIYHSGDCCMYEGLIERLQGYRPDVALLPINGHDWMRTHNNTIGNFNYREVVDLAAEIGIDLTIPMHFGMFPGNTEPPGHFVDYAHNFYPELKTKVMARYEGFVYLKP